MSLLGLRKQKLFRSSKKKKFGWKQIVALSFVLIFIGGAIYGVWYGTRRPAVTISNVTISGGETIAHEDIREAAEILLEGSYVFLIPKRFTYLYPEETISERILQIDRVKDVVVALSSRKELAIVITEYLPHALWCNTLESTNTACFFLDAEGIAFSEAPHLEGNTFIRHITAGRDPVRGEQVYEKDSFELVSEFVKAIEGRHGMRVYAVTMTADRDFRYHIAGGGEIIVDPSIEMQQTFDNLESILDSEEFAHLKPGNFSYIDLRFGDKVYVNEGAEAVEEFPAEEESSVSEEE